MLGVLLLIIAIGLYFLPRHRYLSYLLYISFMLGYGGGLGLLTDQVIGIKNMDIAIIYTFVISLYLLVKQKYYIPKAGFKKWYVAFGVFMFFDVCFSYFYYDFTLYQILQGGRAFLLIFSFPILYQIRKDEITKIFRILCYIITITSVLYILQVVTGRLILPYAGEPSIDPSTGLIRVYNKPPLIGFFLALTFISPEYFGRRVNMHRIIYLGAVFCGLGRTSIFCTLLTVLLAMLFMGKATKIVKTCLILGILILPFMDMLTARYENSDTSGDIESIFSGGYASYQAGEGGNMAYRLAWIYERTEYLSTRPIGEKIFGLGLISDSQPLVNKMYNFVLGLPDPQTDLPTQLSTPDISYGNMITKLGYVGTFIYLAFVIAMAVFLFRNRKAGNMATVCAAELVFVFLLSMAGTALSEPKLFAVYFICIASVMKGYGDLTNSTKGDCKTIG